MISNISSNYNSICKLFNFSKIVRNSSSSNKKILLEMAKNGDQKPKQRTKLGNALCNYISKSQSCYDELFEKQIKELRPDWFISQSEKTNEKKKILLQMAKNGDQKPKNNTKLASYLYNYTIKSRTGYDLIFTKKIKKLRPDWFIFGSEKANKNKQVLIKMAKEGKNRPTKKTKLGMHLSSYIHKSSSCYDSNFKKQIKKIRPDWFRSIQSNENKKILLEMAKTGKEKPKYNTVLGRGLQKYTKSCSSCYNAIFNKQIRKTRPDWFLSTSTKTKNKLLQIAKNGENRPSIKTKLGMSLKNYITKRKSQSCYDELFTKQIKKLRPDWFLK